jgi:hypothetical protein
MPLEKCGIVKFSKHVFLNYLSPLRNSSTSRPTNESKYTRLPLCSLTFSFAASKNCDCAMYGCIIVVSPFHVLLNF